MKHKFILQLLVMTGIGLMTSVFAKDQTQKLTQDEYNQRIQNYIAQVNATKQILDDEIMGNQDADQQRKAFCSRLEAYQGIAQISQENLQLDTANMMLMIANDFLDRQKQSMQISGVALEKFCLVEK
ncbi:MULTISPECIES: hypothetical protein [Acinetobacter]|uniref:hypothetical protein n=1 Tax=Acinetobacter TaxID=469 RepID=UPI0002AE830D|nr:MULTISPECIES: hypothetical protein [Acinetobacter]ELW77663.1 hypothetical protein ACINWC743_2381 [Acinetobacter sp. WC-743]MBJ8424602.1 hypothetical protein [Acinetobacter bereziniae]MBJ8473754.1 hypothetical protein [Acinetobacter bereziniae]